jgi:muconolactone D-isomerase
MEFLVRTVNRMPPETPQELRSALRAAERIRADELRTQGLLIRLWRIPGTTAAVGLYEAPDATVLHDAITSLPMWPWMEVTVEALATHPQERK